MFRKPKLLVTSISIVMLIFEILLLTPLAFPYKPETSFQRYDVRHTSRQFYELDGSLRLNDSGFAIFPQDRRIRSIKKFINLKESLDVEAECELDSICGMPVYGTGKPVNTYFIPGPPPIIHSNILNVTLMNKLNLDENRIRFDIEIEGPDRIFGVLKVRNGSRLTKWSMEPPVETIQNKSSYNFSFMYGGDKKKFNISFEFERSEASEDSTFTLSVVSHYVHETDWFTNDFEDFLRKFPDWVYPSAWVSQYYRRDF